MFWSRAKRTCFQLYIETRTPIADSWMARIAETWEAGWSEMRTARVCTLTCRIRNSNGYRFIMFMGLHVWSCKRWMLIFPFVHGLVKFHSAWEVTCLEVGLLFHALWLEFGRAVNKVEVWAHAWTTQRVRLILHLNTAVPYGLGSCSESAFRVVRRSGGCRVMCHTIESCVRTRVLTFCRRATRSTTRISGRATFSPGRRKQRCVCLFTGGKKKRWGTFQSRRK